MFRRLYISACAGLLAFFIAFRSGVPMWEDWVPGDATDFGVITFFLVYFILRKDLAR
jgi:hypothetical protein